MAVPSAIETTIRTACTHRNDVGVEPSQDRSSFQIATANLGQITQFHRPATSRNTDHRRESFTLGSMPQTAPAGTTMPR